MKLKRLIFVLAMIAWLPGSSNAQMVSEAMISATSIVLETPTPPPASTFTPTPSPASTFTPIPPGISASCDAIRGALLWQLYPQVSKALSDGYIHDGNFWTGCKAFQGSEPHARAGIRATLQFNPPEAQLRQLSANVDYLVGWPAPGESSVIKKFRVKTDSGWSEDMLPDSTTGLCPTSSPTTPVTLDQLCVRVPITYGKQGSWRNVHAVEFTVEIDFKWGNYTQHMIDLREFQFQ